MGVPALLLSCALALIAWVWPGLAQAETLPSVFAQAGVSVFGETNVEGEALRFQKRGRLAFDGTNTSDTRLEVEVQFAPDTGSSELWVAPLVLPRSAEGAAWRVSLRRADSHRGTSLGFQSKTPGPNNKWENEREERRILNFATPASRKAGYSQSWKGKWWKLVMERSGEAVRLVFDGQTIFVKKLSAQGQRAFLFDFLAGDSIRGLHLDKPAPAPFVPLELGASASGTGAHLGDQITVDGVPFHLAEQGRASMDLRQADWPDWKRDPGSTIEGYDSAPSLYPDPRRPMLWAPTADYVAAHVLASVSPDAKAFNGLSLTFGSFGIREQVRNYVVTAPVLPSKGVVRVRVPLHVPLASKLGNVIQIAFNKEVRLAVRQSDPSRFRYRPLGLPSGVRVHAVTLEKSPLQMEVDCPEPGHAFSEPAIPRFRVTLTNVTASAQRFELRTVARHVDGHRMFQSRSGEIAAGGRLAVDLLMPVTRRGYYDYRIELVDKAGERWLVESTSFALLAPDTRLHRARSPFGTWDFSGAHYTSRNADEVGSLYKKLGFRYGMFRFSAEERSKWGVVQGREPVTLGDADAYTSFLKQNSDAPPVALLMHEHGFSERHLLRAPDLFHDRGAYQLDAAEHARFTELFEQSISAARAMRELEPSAHLRLGNGALPVKEEFYRKGFPSELFDSAGNEAVGFGRPPEAQPPDYIAMNASLWMDRQLLDHYGYAEKPVTQCFETCFPSTNPGNLSMQMQADYLVRHALHALAWRIPVIRLGMIIDAGNSYYSSNWGGAGLCTAFPDVRAKPAFTAFATLTAILDGATFRESMDLGSPSLYGLVFDRPGKSPAYALWTPKGRRDVTFSVSGASADFALTDAQGNESGVRAINNQLTVTLGPSPVYLAGIGRLERSQAGLPDHRDGEPANPVTQIATFDNLGDWVVEAKRDLDLEFHNSITPRQKGAFLFELEPSFEGKNQALKVTPQPVKGGTDTMPMYAALQHRRGLALPGRPTAIGLWVNGNSSWGRIIFDLEDARGQRWISIGANSSTELHQAALPLVSRDFAKRARVAEWNSDDVFGLSRFDFDGWRYVAFPLPGNYPGEGYGHPANSQWMHMGDGRVRYPLKLRRLIVELPKKTLHVTAFSPAPRASIYLRQMVVEHGDAEWNPPAPYEPQVSRGPFQ